MDPNYSEFYTELDEAVVLTTTQHTDNGINGIPPPEPLLLKCEQCDAQFTNNKCLKDHKKLLHPRLIFFCPYCIRTFEVEQSLRGHISVKHNPNKESNGNSEQGNNSNEGLPQPSQIGTTGTSEPTFITAPTGTEHSSSQNADSGIPTRKPLPLKCDHCAVKFYSMSDYKKHQKLATRSHQPELEKEEFNEGLPSRASELRGGRKKKERAFCMICKKQINARRGWEGNILYFHKIELHDPKHKFACNICHQRFKLEENLNSHLQVVKSKCYKRNRILKHENAFRYK
ncbi:hypothetical protein JTB14_008911 [Gonioctena quinquepunctata]|nr:hypothetical protein JTB14_008911 [Gonioctena quinquepunctata]